MESFKKEQLKHMPTSSVNFLEELPDVVFYAVMEKLPGRVIENTVRQLSKNCYRRVELRRARLPRVYLERLYVCWNWFEYRRPCNGVTNYDKQTVRKMIAPADLIQHLEYLKERATFDTLILLDVDWDMFANCKFKCEELSCLVRETTLSPERFMDIFRSIRPTSRLVISADGDNKIFPLTRDFFTNNYAIGLQEVWLQATGDAMVDPLNDTILRGSTPLILCSHFRTSSECTLDGILRMIREWYTSERQIDEIAFQAVIGGEAEYQNFCHNLSGLLAVKRILCKGDIYSMVTLERANGDLAQFCCSSYMIGQIENFKITMIRLVPGPEPDLYRRYRDL